jgi:hypothetical protein
VSGAGCTQTGQTVRCTIGTLAVGATVALYRDPARGSQTVSLTFTASSSNLDLNPADGMKTVALNVPSEANGSDAPLPLWASIALALLLLLIANRRVTAQTPLLARRLAHARRRLSQADQCYHSPHNVNDRPNVNRTEVAHPVVGEMAHVVKGQRHG